MNCLQRGILIALEGFDGSGKSTLATGLFERPAEAAGLSVLLTREPGGTALGSEIRTLLQDNRKSYVCSDRILTLLGRSRSAYC